VEAYVKRIVALSALLTCGCMDAPNTELLQRAQVHATAQLGPQAGLYRAEVVRLSNRARGVCAGAAVQTGTGEPLIYLLAYDASADTVLIEPEFSAAAGDVIELCANWSVVESFTHETSDTEPIARELRRTGPQE
jgi:hypothetical protein